MTTPSERAQQVLQTWPIPTVNSGTINVKARLGKATVVVGANGSGKSALSRWRPAIPARTTCSRKLDCLTLRGRRLFEVCTAPSAPDPWGS